MLLFEKLTEEKSIILKHFSCKIKRLLLENNVDFHKYYTVLPHVGTAGLGGWGMYTIAEMQVMRIMLNRCDSML